VPATFKYLLLFCCMGLFFSCGIEEYVYLDPVETAYPIDVTRGRIIVPNSSANSYFRYYTLLYRIYMSDINLSSITSDLQRQDLNPVLASHYNMIDPYTVNENFSPSAIGSVFNNLRYYQLYVSLDKLSEIAMAELLNSGGYGTIIRGINWRDEINLDFTDTDDGPFITLRYDNTLYPDSDRLYLFRASSGFTPLPADRLFYFSDDLVNIISSQINADVEPKANNTSSERIAYVSIYILATGIDDNYTLIYSRPKHVGIFRLSNKPG
jgi:hypothetical protein